jgi:hypothetical protein
MVVNHGRKQIVRGGDGVEIAGEVQIDILHRHDLRITAARRAAFQPKTWAEGRLAERNRRFFAHYMERIGKSHTGRSFALTRRRRIDGRHQDELPVRALLDTLPNGRRDFRLELSVKLQLVLRDAKRFRNLPNWFDHSLLGNFHIALHTFPLLKTL